MSRLIWAGSSDSAAASNGEAAVGSSTMSPSSASPSSRSGVDSDSVSAANRRISVTLSSAMSRSVASSATVGRRPYAVSSRTRAFCTRARLSPACTGSRMVRLVLAMPRVRAWRIHHVA